MGVAGWLKPHARDPIERFVGRIVTKRLTVTGYRASALILFRRQARK
jgi:hypothetical protein